MTYLKCFSMSINNEKRVVQRGRPKGKIAPEKRKNIRKQILLDSVLSRKLGFIAENGVESESSHIREALRKYIENYEKKNGEIII